MSTQRNPGRVQQSNLKIVGGPTPAKKLPPRVKPPVNVNFDQWWSRTSTAKKIKPELKNPIRLHLQARGFMKSGNFDAGLKDFGL